MPIFTTAFFVSLAITAISIGVQMILASSQRRPQQQRQATPKPADGKVTSQQNVPSLPVVLGRAKRTGDQFFMEERSGALFWGIVFAGHRINRYVAHYLHDEEITLSGDANGSNVIGPVHFYTYYDGGLFVYVSMQWRLGLPLETAYSYLTGNFPELWTADHRGDGLASAVYAFQTAPDSHFANVYPNGRPEPSAIIEGALVYDPRDDEQDPDDPDTWAFSTNLALLRLHHLTQPYGGRLSLTQDMNLDDWAAAADVCDETVYNRTAGEESRYHGGLWFRYDSDQIDIGRLIDEAGELVLYEDVDGRVGVHPGAMVAPDIRITADDIIAIKYDANRRSATNVLAVRGRFTDPEQVYNTVDAAIYGDPYTGDDTQRTATIDNQAVQSHNHMARLQKLKFIRANAPRVSITMHYDASGSAANVRERRWVTVHYPSRGMEEATVEILGRPKLSVQDLTYTFDGIVVPADLYAFEAATEEGAPSGSTEEPVSLGIPVPTGFAVEIESETVSAGQPQSFAVASWTHVSDALTYEIEYQIADASAPAKSVISLPGDDEVRTPYLADGTEYRFRLRTKSNGANSLWTSYANRTTSSDSVAPGQPTGLDSSAAGFNVTITWANPNSPNLYRTVLYRSTTPSFGDAEQIYIVYGGIAEGRSYDDNGLAAFEYYWWVRSFNASGVASDPVGPTSQDLS
jgi:hypothetical protein